MIAMESGLRIHWFSGLWKSNRVGIRIGIEDNKIIPSLVQIHKYRFFHINSNMSVILMLYSIKIIMVNTILSNKWLFLQNLCQWDVGISIFMDHALSFCMTMFDLKNNNYVNNNDSTCICRMFYWMKSVEKYREFLNI